MYELCHEIPYTNHMKIQRQAMIEISPLKHMSFSINKELSIHFDEGIRIERYDWAEQKYQKKSWPIKNQSYGNMAGYIKCRNICE